MTDPGHSEGLVAGRYQIEGRLGAGGMGEVYKARDRKLRRDVAIKRLPPAVAGDAEHRRQLLREARSAAQISHQNVATLHDVIEDGDELYLVMELAEGTTLRSMLDQPLDPLDAVRMLEDVASGLAAAHHRGVVHYDLKPSNLMVSADGRVKILDFGLARARAASVDPDSSTTSVLDAGPAGAGTPPYMSPEVMLGKRADARADLFSLGVVFYQMLTGKNPFMASTSPAVVDRILNHEPPPVVSVNPAVPPQLDPILRKLLAKEPRFRYATVDDLLVDLRSLEMELTRPGSVSRVAVPARRPAWPLALGIAASSLAALLLIGWSISTRWSTMPDGSAAARVTVADLQRANLLLAIVPTAGVDQVSEDLVTLTNGLATMVAADLTQLTRSHTFQLAGPGQPAFRVLDPGAAGSPVNSVADARRLFGAALVLTIDAHRQDDRVLVSLALTDATTGVQLDAATVSGQADAFLDLYDQVARRVLRLLRLDATPLESAGFAPGTEVDPAWGYFVSAEGYLADRRYDLAADQLERALAIDPSFVAAHARLGEALAGRHAQDRDPIWLERALQECEEALRLDANDASGSACKGRALFAGGQFAEAIPLLRDAFRLEPTRISVVRDLSDAYDRTGDAIRAEAVLEEAIQMRPHVAALHDLLGAFHFFAGDTEGSRRQFEEAVRLAPDRFSAYSNLGVALYFLERWPEARRAFERAIELNDRYYVGYSNAGTLAFFEGDYSQAAAYYERALAADDTDLTVWGNLGDACAMLPGREQDAVAAWQRAVDLATAALARGEGDAALEAKLGYYLASLGEARSAEPHLVAALSGDAVRASVMAKVAQARQRLGQSDEALRLVAVAVEAGYSRAELRVDPIFQSHRGSPRWEAIVNPTH